MPTTPALLRASLLSLMVSIILLITLTGCGGGSSSPSVQSPPAADSATAVTKIAAVEVPLGLQLPPLDQTRQLTVPAGYRVRVLARVPGARFLLVLPNGSFLVSQPSTGTITLVVPQSANTVKTSVFASGLSTPHDMVLAQLGGTYWLYVAESNRVTRAVYHPGDTTMASATPVVSNLPDGSTPELRGAYAHGLKNIAVSASGSLYVSIASSCNACVADTTSSPVRGAIYRYDADGGNPRLYARGIRNAEGLDMMPGTERLWAVVNGRDQIPYPFRDDVDGDGQIDYGKVLTTYVDNQPPDPFTEITDGGNLGWPFCNPLANPMMTNLAFAPDVDNNADGSKLDCSRLTPIAHGFHAHSAPLGFSFLQAATLPDSWRGGAAVALHGCWNCSRPFGYKVVLVRFDGNGRPASEVDLVSGFAASATGGVWGRPVDVVAHPARSSLLISDDVGGAIYELYPG